jgi:hypothetical protein
MFRMCSAAPITTEPGNVPSPVVTVAVQPAAIGLVLTAHAESGVGLRGTRSRHPPRMLSYVRALTPVSLIDTAVRSLCAPLPCARARGRRRKPGILATGPAAAAAAARGSSRPAGGRARHYLPLFPCGDLGGAPQRDSGAAGSLLAQRLREGGQPRGRCGVTVVPAGDGRDLGDGEAGARRGL